MDYRSIPKKKQRQQIRAGRRAGFFGEAKNFSFLWQKRPLYYCIALALVLSCLYAGASWWWRKMRWRYIVLHHTAAERGSLEFYRKQHKKKWGDLAYHIMVNNGSDGTAPGQIQYSERWHKKQPHYSTQHTYLNYFGIAVALVGNFEKHAIPKLQKESLLQLLVNLSREYYIPTERIIGHREVQNTKCPGRHINMVELRSLLKEKLREAAQ